MIVLKCTYANSQRVTYSASIALLASRFIRSLSLHRMGAGYEPLSKRVRKSWWRMWRKDGLLVDYCISTLPPTGERIICDAASLYLSVSLSEYAYAEGRVVTVTTKAAEYTILQHNENTRRHKRETRSSRAFIKSSLTVQLLHIVASCV